MKANIVELLCLRENTPLKVYTSHYFNVFIVHFIFQTRGKKPGLLISFLSLGAFPSSFILSKVQSIDSKHLLYYFTKLIEKLH